MRHTLQSVSWGGVPTCSVARTHDPSRIDGVKDILPQKIKATGAAGFASTLSVRPRSTGSLFTSRVSRAASGGRKMAERTSSTTADVTAASDRTPPPPARRKSKAGCAAAGRRVRLSTRAAPVAEETSSARRDRTAGRSLARSGGGGSSSHSAAASTGPSVRRGRDRAQTLPRPPAPPLSELATAPASAPTSAPALAQEFASSQCPNQGSLATAPEQPWQDARLVDLQAGALASLRGMGAFAASSGLRIACTEGGWLAAPWAAETGWGNQYDLADNTMHALDTWGPAQALAYTALLSQIEAQPWFVGGWWWLWRADPTAGGTSDPSPTPWAKEASAAIAALWLPTAESNASAAAAAAPVL